MIMALNPYQETCLASASMSDIALVLERVAENVFERGGLRNLGLVTLAAEAHLELVREGLLTWDLPSQAVGMFLLKYTPYRLGGQFPSNLAGVNAVLIAAAEARYQVTVSSKNLSITPQPF